MAEKLTAFRGRRPCPGDLDGVAEIPLQAGDADSVLETQRRAGDADCVPRTLTPSWRRRAGIEELALSWRTRAKPETQTPFWRFGLRYGDTACAVETLRQASDPSFALEILTRRRLRDDARRNRSERRMR
jgi:hypothetical protein